MKTQLGYYCYNSFSHKNSDFEQLEFEVFIEVWFWLYDATLTANGNLLQNAKRECIISLVVKEKFGKNVKNSRNIMETIVDSI